MATLVDNLRRSAERFPQHTALQDGAVSITYQQFHLAAAAFAGRLLELGVKAGDRVAFVLPNSIEFAIAYYGVWMAGGVVVLLNPAGTRRDFNVWLRHCEPRCVLTEPTHVDAVEGAQSSMVQHLLFSTRDVVLEGLDRATPRDVRTPVHLDCVAPACIIYTSGTTGEPKGVTLSHANLVANTHAIVSYLELSARDSIVSILPFYYSYGSSVLHTHVEAGACVILEKNFVYPHAVIATLARTRATGFSGVPSTFALLLARVKLPDFDLRALRYITQAGGPMSPALTQRLREATPAARLFVMYGQTEVTARISYLPPRQLNEKLGSVGVPIAGLKWEVRDENGESMKAGGVGEVWVAGTSVMLGYWRNEAATACVLRDGWLNTGDMGRLDEEGFLYLVGRRTDMIKTGAHRVHPREIEEVILELPEVEEAAAIGIEDELLGQVIKAFVVAAPDCSVTTMQVQAHCRSRVAHYKVPKIVEVVTSLPKTSSGKIKRTELVGRKPK